MYLDIGMGYGMAYNIYVMVMRHYWVLRLHLDIGKGYGMVMLHYWVLRLHLDIGKGYGMASNIYVIVMRHYLY